MSLRSDIKFVVRLICHSIGDLFLQLADYFQNPPESSPVPPREEPPPVLQNPPTRVRRQTISRRPPSEVISSIADIEVRPPKVRDRSGYNPKDHNQFKVAAIGILRTLLDDGLTRPASAPALTKGLEGSRNESTESTIRSTCKILVKDEVLQSTYEDSCHSHIYWVSNKENARKYLAELEANAPYLPNPEGPTS